MWILLYHIGSIQSILKEWIDLMERFDDMGADDRQMFMDENSADLIRFDSIVSRRGKEVCYSVAEREGDLTFERDASRRPRCSRHDSMLGKSQRIDRYLPVEYTWQLNTTDRVDTLFHRNSFLPLREPWNDVCLGIGWSAGDLERESDDRRNDSLDTVYRHRLHRRIADHRSR